ncbi:FecR domain-containing protein [uncultured Parabacteroides sp.]|uniref:FecR family protein n=1 Tax=uncultured Parabacteroides sp. TaxID=512312 RepID=UPI00258ED003|nr:FecR domain-containing protein [uncultured Parabacteroides sp.]
MENELDKMAWLKYMRFKSEETDSEAVYRRLWTRIQENTSSDLPRAKSRKVFLIYRIAAVMLLLLGISGLYFLSQDFPHEELIVLESGSMSIRTIELSDGTIVKMGANSKFSYPKEFKKNVRRVEVDGQCFFQVKKDTERPFVVSMENIDVTVLGTQFEVFSYGPEEKTEVTLLSGKVQINAFSDWLAEKQTVVLHPDQKMVFNKKDGSIDVEEIDAGKYLSWQKSGILSFENESLAVIIPRLEQWFGCKIVYPETGSDNLRVTVKIKTETLEETLNIISLTTKYKYVYTDGIYKFY